MAGERVDVVEADVGAVGEHRRPVSRDRASRPGVTIEREVLGAVGVGEHEEAVAGRADVVLDVVLVALLAWLDDDAARRSASSASTSHTSLVTFDADVITRNAAAAGAADATRRSGRRPPGTRARRRSAGVPSVWRHTCHGRIASSGRV